MHKNFAVKPKCCGHDMTFQEGEDGADWFECEQCESWQWVPEGYWDDTPDTIKVVSDG